MNSNQAREAMVDNQIRPADVIDYRVLEAFLSTKREHFIPDASKAKSYGEYEIEFAEGRRMMTPRSFAKLVQLALPEPEEDVLLIGAATGYEMAILSQLAGFVIGVENQAALVKTAESHLAEEGYDNAAIVKGPLHKGAKDSGPYDLIMINGAIGELPKKLAKQLKPEGRIAVYFEEEGVYTAKMLYPQGDKLFERTHFYAAAPLLPGFEKAVEFSF